MKGKFVKRFISFLLISVVISFAFWLRSNLQKQSGQKLIAVNQYVSHPILDAVLEGFKERLIKNKDLQIIVKNSNADVMTCRQINEQFMRQKVAIIVALGTPSAQSAIEVAKGKIPVVFGAITDPIGAKLADSLEHPGGNKTGTTNRWPFSAQIQLIKKIFPKSKVVGTIVNLGEENCRAGQEVFRREAYKLGLNLVEVPVSNSAEVKTTTEILISKKVDVILISPSNTVFSALDALICTAHSAKIPIIGGDESAVIKGSIATYGFSNKDVGIATAEVVLKILKIDPKNKVGDIPVARPRENHLFINRKVAEQAGISLPTDLLRIAKEV